MRKDPVLPAPRTLGAVPWTGPSWDQHAVFLDDLLARGRIELAGPLADGSGALVVVRSESVDEVRGWFEADPWTLHDVLPVREVQEWTIFLDGRAAPNA